MEEQTTIVIDVTLNEQDIQQRLGEVNTAIRSVEESNKKLKASMKENGDELGINSRLLAQNEALLKSLKAEQSALSGQVRASMQSYQKYGTSIKELTAKMNALKEEYRSLTREQREGAEGNALKQQISELREEINEANHSLGDFQDNVGNYPGAVEPVTAQIKELTQALIAMKVAGQEGTEEYQQTLQRLGELKDAAGDAQAEIKQMASDTSNLNSVLQGAQVTAGAFSTALGVMNLVGAKDSETAKDLAKAQKTLQSAIAITTGLQSIQNALQKESALMMGIQKIQTWAAAKAQDEYTAATGRATIAQKIFNTVAESNPYVLLAAVILTVVGALVAFTLGSKEQEDQIAKTNAEIAKQIEYIRTMKDSYGTLYDSTISYQQRYIDELKIQGATLEEIRAEEDRLYETRGAALEAEQDLLLQDIAYEGMYQTNMLDNIEKLKKKKKDYYDAVNAQQESLILKYQQEMDEIQALIDRDKQRLDMINDFRKRWDAYQVEGQKRQADRDAEDKANAEKAAEEEKKRQQESVRRANEAAAKKLEIERKRLEQLRKLENEFNKLVLDQANTVVDRYTKDKDEEIAVLRHRLDTERGLTVKQRAEINQRIIELELEKNERIAQMNLDNRTAELEEERRLKQQEIDDTLKQLEDEGVLTNEIKQKYEDQRAQNEQNYNNAVAQLIKDHTIQVNQFRRDAEKQTLDNITDENIAAYEQLTEEYEIEAKKRLLIANDNEEMAADAEVQNASDKLELIKSMTEEAKQAMFESEEAYKLAVLEAETQMTNAIKARTQMQIESAKKQMQSVAQIFDTLSGVMADYAEESEEAAAYEKILSLAKIAMATGVAIAEGVKVATDSSKTWYEAVIAIATMVATVIANTASAVKMVNSAKFAEGGIVDGNSYSGDKVNARLNSGEMVLNREQQANLFRMINQPKLSDNTEQLTVAFATALSEMPNPVLDYSEYMDFTKGVNERKNKTIIK